jgi:hypothetical protein
MAKQTILKSMAKSMSPERSMQFHDLAPALEFMCWVVVILIPLLRWVNGPAVTDDQFYIQCALAAMALIGAIAMRLYNWRNR